MSINVTLVGQLLAILLIICPLIAYRLGRRKTGDPLANAAIAFVLTLLFPLVLIYLFWLWRKPDNPAN